MAGSAGNGAEWPQQQQGRHAHTVRGYVAADAGGVGGEGARRHVYSIASALQRKSTASSSAATKARGRSQRVLG